MKLHKGKLAIFMVTVVVTLAYRAFSSPEPASVAVAGAPAAASGELQGYRQVKVVMYSLTTCGYCTAMRRELNARNIPFTEYFLDAEPGRKDELAAKLQRAGFRPGVIGTPTMEVNGVMLPNNPSIRTVLKHL